MTLANWLTLSRIYLTMVFGVEYCRGNPVTAFIAFALACMSDVLDGFIARNFNMVSNIGKLLDPIADKIMIITGLGCLLWSGIISKTLFVSVVVLEIIVIIGGLFFLIKGTVVHSKNYGKSASVFFTLGIAIGILGLREIAAGFLVSAIICGVFSMGYCAVYFS